MSRDATRSTLGCVWGRRAPAAVLAVTLAASACGGDDDTVEGPPPAAPDRIALTSSAFEDGAEIPSRFTCDGEDVSPPLEWDGVPAGTRELALLVEDPDAPGGTFVHWTVYAIPPDTEGIPEGTVPTGAREGETSFGDPGYGGPCPPEDDAPHRYEFALYALRAPIGLEEEAAPEEVRAAIADQATARGLLTGRYGR
jgi:Raf kinase inhibitor-like YbhB/YbcL family protein